MDDPVQCPACGRETTADPSLGRVRLFRDSPSTLAIHALAGAAEGRIYAADEHEQKLCKHWLDRLVDEEGNPKDDDGRTALEHVMQENALNENGTLSSVSPDVDRVSMAIVVSRRAARLDRGDLRTQLVAHAETYVDHLLDALYAEPVEA